MGSLPLPPQVPNFGGPAPFQGYNAPQNQAQSAPPNTGANIIQGISAFLEQYKKSKESERQDAMGKAQQHIQNLLLGLPVDLKKTAQAMKKAGLDIDFDSTTSFTGPSAPQTHTPTGPVPGGPATTDLGPSPVQTPAAQPQQGFWDRVKSQYLGQGGQVSDSSPGMESLRRMQQRGQQNTRLDQGKANLEEKALGVQDGAIDIESQKQALVIGALAGNPEATDRAQRMGIMQDLKGDEIFRMGHAAGLTDEQIGKGFMGAQFGNNKMLEMQISMADGMKKFFGNDLAKSMKYVNDVFTEGKSQLQPEAVSIDDRLKMMQATVDIQKQYPTVPLNLANTYAMAEASGDKDTASKLRNLISSKFPTSGEVDWKKWSAGMDQQVKQFNQATLNFNREYELNVMNAVRGQMGNQFDQSMKILESKQATDEEKNVARSVIADAMNKLTELKVKLPGGGTVTLGPGDLATRSQKGWFGLSWNNSRELTQAASAGSIEEALKAGTSPPPSLGPGEVKNWREDLKKRLQFLNLLGSPEASGALPVMIGGAE